LKQRKLYDIADRFDNLRVPIPASDRISGDTPYYGANGIQDYVEGFTHDGEFILVAEDGANDLKNYPLQYVNGKVWVNNHAHVIQGKKTITDNKFLMNSIKNFNIEPFLVGGGRTKLNADVMMKLNILLPSFKEQEKILKEKKKKALAKEYEKLGRKFYKKSNAKSFATANNMLEHIPMFEKRKQADNTPISEQNLIHLQQFANNLTWNEQGNYCRTNDIKNLTLFLANFRT